MSCLFKANDSMLQLTNTLLLCMESRGCIFWQLLPWIDVVSFISGEAACNRRKAWNGSCQTVISSKRGISWPTRPVHRRLGKSGFNGFGIVRTGLWTASLLASTTSGKEKITFQFPSSAVQTSLDNQISSLLAVFYGYSYHENAILRRLEVATSS
jgi:hypothetical protein